MKLNTLAILLIALILAGCSSQKKEAELLELTRPEWLKNRPVSSAYFYGIGTTPKVGGAMFYDEQAKDKALADLSKQISTKIKSEQNMYRMEDNKGVYEYIQSRVKATSEEFLEGYEFVDKWEDLSNYYAFYRLSKSKFYALKAQRKKEALQLSLLKLEQAQDAQQKHEIMLALEQYAAAIDAISGYLNEETSIESSTGKIDLFEESKEGINKLIQQLSITFNQPQISAENNKRVAVGTAQVLVRCNSIEATGIPVRFNYSGGFLVHDKHKSDGKGFIPSPEFSFGTKTEETLRASIDLKAIGRHITRNLIVRQLIEKQKAAKTQLTIKSAE